MKVEEIVRRVQSIFGDETESVVTLQDIIDWTNSGMVKIAREAKVLQADVDVPITSISNGYTLPVDFISDDQVTYNGNILRRTDLQYIQGVMGNSNLLGTANNSDPATMYYIYARKLWLFPWPKVDSTTATHLWYTRLPAPVDGSNDTPELPIYMHEDLVTYCLMRANEKNADYEQARQVGAQLVNDVALSKSEANGQDSDSYSSVRQYDGDLW